MPLENKTITIDTCTLWDIVERYLEHAEERQTNIQDLTYNCLQEIQKTAEKQRKKTQCK